MMPRVAIIYLCYNMEQYLDDVVDCIADQSYPRESLAVVFVPNGSPDQVAANIRRDVLLRAGVDFPQCHLIDDGVNRGFAGGNNAGMQWAIDNNFDFVFLHNGDLKLDPNAIEEAVATAMQDDFVGAVQSLVLYWKKPELINTSGGVIHIAGYGYARDNLAPRSERIFEPAEEIGYASGAAVLYRASALREVGLLEEGFFMYHEDLELGLRLRTAGYKNVLSPKSIAYHDYSFSRNPKKFAWMELYRWVVTLAYYKPFTLLLLAPVMLGVELATIPLSAIGGWFGAKVWAYGESLRPRTWHLVARMHRRVIKLRKVSDAELLHFVVGGIESQEVANPIVERVANPILLTYVSFLKRAVRW